ncbi:DNA alkylation repair protein, partial [Achromobacter ruhlandii]|uniref:DNA alkylation repair protein n=1 Tax=Achromobacter ruhlandii TaxID=72557 RepID=UPI001B8B6929
MSAARRGVKDIGADRLARLNAGAPATHLTECLAVDFARLMQALAPEVGADGIAAMRAAAALGISRRMVVAARILHERLGPAGCARMAAQASDTARGWACFMIGAAPDVPLAQRLARIRPLPDAAHLGVRARAGLALPPAFTAQLAAGHTHMQPRKPLPSQRLRSLAPPRPQPRSHMGPPNAAPPSAPGRDLAQPHALRRTP